MMVPTPQATGGKIEGRTVSEWCALVPVLSEVVAGRETCWHNPATRPTATALAATGLGAADIDDAARRLERFRPLIARLFPKTAPASGRIESPLVPIPAMQQRLAQRCGNSLPGRLLLKCDNLLPISGSIKARGGIYEVLKHAETVAIRHQLLTTDDDYALLAEERCRRLFGTQRIAVGSTGNLGLSIGIMGAALGFRVAVHMSVDARPWKKVLLRSHGVEVIEHQADYGTAVAAGREQATADPQCHFIDDENSTDLFLGYSVAGARLATQLSAMNLVVDADHPLFVYLPCGVGGGPGGVTFGLKQQFGDHVHCFFAEPTHSPSMLLGLATNLHERVAVTDFGLDNITAADGLAVARPSGFIGRILAPLIDGVCTVSDATLYRLLAMLADSERIELEPSALAGMAGICQIATHPSSPIQPGLAACLDHATHIVWATGGSMVPPTEMAQYCEEGRRLLAEAGR